jgi:hypothetical protein
LQVQQGDLRVELNKLLVEKVDQLGKKRVDQDQLDRQTRSFLYSLEQMRHDLQVQQEDLRVELNASMKSSAMAQRGVSVLVPNLTTTGSNFLTRRKSKVNAPLY